MLWPSEDCPQPAISDKRSAPRIESDRGILENQSDSAAGADETVAALVEGTGREQRVGLAKGSRDSQVGSSAPTTIMR